jgi:hypothetical protein
MPITTTDVVTNIVSGNEVQKNATYVAYCQRTGEYNALNSTYETSISYNNLANKYTNRFDDVTYYTIGSSGIIGV